MKGFYAALISGAVGIGCLAAIATIEPTPNFTGCEVEAVFEDGSFTMGCPPVGGIEDLEPVTEPDFEPDFWEQLDIMRDLEGLEYA